MRFRLPLVTLALLLGFAAPARAFNPQTVGLQVALRAFGTYSGPVDGVSGQATVSAVRAFQQRHGLPVDGLAGPATRRALGPLGRPLFGRRQLRTGAFGWDVAALQFLLARHGLGYGAIDGYFGPETAKALRAYQRTLRLSADGVAGRATLASFDLHIGVQATPARRAVASASTSDVRASLDRWSRHYGLDPSLTRALAWMESGFNPNLTSSVGAWGVMQILPTTWDYAETVLIGANVPHTTDGNVHVGTAYLHHLLREFNGDERLALAGWYQGAAALHAHGVYNESKPFVANVVALKARFA